MSGVPVRDRWLLGLILLFAALMRAAYLIEVWQAPDYDRPQFESQYHDYWARALVSGDWTPPVGVTDPDIPNRAYFRPPGYPTFLAAIYRVGGGGHLWPRLVQMLLGLASCLIVVLLTRRWFGSGAALVAGALQGGYWVFIYFEGEFMAPPLLIVLILISLASVSRWTGRTTPGTAVMAGVSAGAAALVRPNCLVLIPVFLLWGIWVERRRGAPDWAGFARAAVIFAGSAALAILPATVRNHRAADDWVLITSNAGINLFIGTHPDSDGFTPGVPELAELTGMEGWDSFDYPLIAAAVARHEGREMKDSEVSRWFTHRAVERALGNPGAVLRSFGRKLLLFWGPAEISNTKVIQLERLASPTLGSSVDFATVLALGLLGIGFAVAGLRSADGVAAGEPARPDPAIVALLLLFIAAYSASYAPFFVAARFRVPVIPVLIIFAGYALQQVWRLAAARRWPVLVVVLVALGGLRLATGVEWVPYEPDEALWHWRRGLLYEQAGRSGPAMDEFRAAVAARPDHPGAQLSLAEACAAAGDLDQAIRHYELYLQLDPLSVPGRNNYALALARRGDLEAAIVQWEQALRVAPGDPDVAGNLVAAYRAAGRDVEARVLEERIETGRVSSPQPPLRR